ncbi:MAG: glycerophosphodiester phosphodiesterase family protein [Methyloligellaceae bacterium]
MGAQDISWLCRPIAHRGFHDKANGIIENSASAVKAAISRGYAIEVDVQASSELEPIVFHDRKLSRLTPEKGRVQHRSLPELKSIQYKGSDDHIICLKQLLELVDGQVPILVEIKGRKNSAREFGRRVGQITKDYPGPVAVMSFEPELVISCIEAAPELPRGLTISYFGMPVAGFAKFAAMYVGIGRRIQPQFIACDVRTLPGLLPVVLKNVLGMKLLAWTVCKQKQIVKAEKWADAMIFEGFEA